MMLHSKIYYLLQRKDIVQHEYHIIIPKIKVL